MRALYCGECLESCQRLKYEESLRILALLGDHVILVLKPSDSKGLSKEVVTRISACLRGVLAVDVFWKIILKVSCRISLW